MSVTPTKSAGNLLGMTDDTKDFQNTELGKAPAKRVLTVREFIDQFGICRATFYNLLRRGDLTAHRVLGRTVVKIDEAERWFSSLPEVSRRGGVGKNFDRKSAEG